MTAVSELESLRNLLREQGLGSALPSPGAKSHPAASTGLDNVDALLGGGIPRGQITELVGAGSSGRTSVTFAIVAEATARGEVAAYIDATDSLDPRSAQRAGIALDRLLWVRCGTAASAFAGGSLGKGEDHGGHPHEYGDRAKEAPHADAGQDRRVAAADRRERLSLPVRFSKKNDPAWQAVNLVASAGGFGVIVLDLGGLSKRKLREWRSRQWLRLRRAIEHSPTALVVLASEHLASSVSALVIEMVREKTRWRGASGVSLLLEGMAVQVRVRQQRKGAAGGAEAKDCRLEIGP